ncbi:MAG: dsDNA nuclease domain-containing protein [Pseudomonadales bacterium]
MSGIRGATELLSVANNPKYSEAGGGHGAKGVDFARWWAVVRMVELEKANEPDFLLFESVQDVAELDSATEPTRARVYQVKKKDAGTWSWSVLTGTVAPKGASTALKKPTKAPAATRKR